MLAYCFDGFNTAILRLYDRFVCLLVPQVVGSGLTFLVIIVYLLLLKASNCCEIGWIIAAFAAGAFIQSIVPFIISIKLIGEKHGWKSKGNPLFALRPYKRLLASNLFHTNLVGYLKIASDNGGVFLLGVLSTPIQVAYFGIAQQMMAPLKLIKVNIQNAITPEIMRLWSRKEVTQLYALINGVVRSTAMWGGVAVVFMVIIIKPLLLIITTSAYISAIPTVCLMILAGFLNFISTSFYPLTVAMDKMPRRNMIVGLRIFYLGAALFIGLNSFLLAAVHLLGVISVRLFSDLPLFLRLRSMSQTGEVKTILNQ
jgi:O-antigen/teichoic acid export membrane protein